MRVQHGALQLNGAPHMFVIRDFPSVLEKHVKESRSHALQFVEQRLTFARAAGHVGHDAESAHTVVTAQHLDQGVRIGDRSGLVGDHHEHVLGSL